MVVHVSDYIYWVEAVSLTGGKMLLAWIMREITHEDWDADSILKQFLIFVSSLPAMSKS